MQPHTWADDVGLLVLGRANVQAKEMLDTPKTMVSAESANQGDQRPVAGIVNVAAKCRSRFTDCRIIQVLSEM